MAMKEDTESDKKPRREKRPPLEPEQARSVALNRLSAREYSAGEMKQYLRRRGLAADEAEKLVTTLCEEGWINDARYQRAMARVQLIRDKGPMAIMAKLRQKGVTLSLSEARKISDEESGKEELERVREILHKRWPQAAHDQAEARRAYGGLVRRGFSPSVVARAIREKGREIED